VFKNLLAALAVALGAAACAAAPPLPSQSVPPVQWRDCSTGLQCASVTVPADWRRPDGPQIAIGIGRFPARDPATRVGTLLLNPGGPQPVLFGLDRLAPLASTLTEWFDVVVFDPRGMGESGGVSCPTPAPAQLTAVPPDPAAFDALVAANQRFTADCAAALGPLAGNIDAWQVAHDMDALRAALGEPRLNYFGNSYGTVYGQAYLELFPDRVGRMYLDSVADHTTPDLLAMVAPKAQVLEANLHGFAEWCQREPACALHGQDALAVWDRVLATAERAPIPAGATTVDAATLRGSAVLMIRRERSWPNLATGLAAADRGDATAFVPAAAPPAPAVPGAALLGTATCADLLAEPIDREQVAQLAESLRAVAPRIGWTEPWNFQARCAGLPTGSFPPHPIPVAGQPPVLVVNGADDSATPPEFGRRLVAQLPGSRYLPAGGGHAVYLSGDPCVRGHVDRYLATGELPAPDATCLTVPS
jgi:pimeloyl-ACP methyl ester carboxylesterase